MEEMKEKWQEAEDLMSHMSLPEALRQQVRRDKQDNWKLTLGVELDTFFRDLQQDLRRDIKRHLCLTLLKRVPVFKQMDDILLDAVCERLKQVLYRQNSFIVRRGEPASKILFITRGEVELERYITDEGTFAYFNARNLKAGDYFGGELLTWVSDPRSQLPFYTRTAQALMDVQAFALVADDLLFLASQFSSFRSRRVQYAFRFCSHEWRTWAACYIQTAWRTHCKRKREKMYNA
ncbi:putative cyclic nucleotide-binding domain, rmlC-like jelly roll [Helianthus annuus]|nr:putative cyclic nucleotide-binding domain, rmlC-like jelly roll [Helianthus annuus]